MGHLVGYSCLSMLTFAVKILANRAYNMILYSCKIKKKKIDSYYLHQVTCWMKIKEKGGWGMKEKRVARYERDRVVMWGE